MKNFLYILILLLISCQPKPKDDRPLVSVSILPQKYFVDQIAGNLLQVNVLVPPGSSPHNYEILPSQMKDLSHSKAWLQVGLLTFEDALKDKLSSVNKEVPMVNCSEGIIPIEGSEEEGHDHDHGHHEVYDPHIWLAPAESKIIAQNTLKVLLSAFPENEETFNANYSKLIARIDSVATEIEQKLSGLTNRHILIFHPALAYYARQFNMQQIALEMDGKEPSPRHLKEIVDLAHAQNIHLIFIQKEFDVNFAQQLSREINGKVEVIDPLDYDWEKQMLDITQKIAAQ